MGKNLEIICMEGKDHIFTFDLIFSGQCAIPRGPVFSKYNFFPFSN